jgi:hypothetical protein
MNTVRSPALLRMAQATSQLCGLIGMSDRRYWCLVAVWWLHRAGTTHIRLGDPRAQTLATIRNSPDLHRLLTFEVPNLASIFRYTLDPTESAHVRCTFRNILVVKWKVVSLLPNHQARYIENMKINWLFLFPSFWFQERNSGPATYRLPN